MAMGLSRLLPPRLKTWVTVKIIQSAIQEVNPREVGVALDKWLDTKLGEHESERVQNTLIHWLDDLRVTLETDHAGPDP